jgi:hypothetical protein
MSTFHGNIGEIEKFDPNNYPKIVAELTTMLASLKLIPVYFKREMVISYLKDHCMRTEWIAANPNLAALITSGNLATTHLEMLFESCRWNKSFRTDLERYVKEQLN